MGTYDHLKKQIDEIAGILKKLKFAITNLKETDKADETIEMINQALLQVLNLNLDGITNISLDQFITSLTADDRLTNHNLDLLADLFFQTGAILEKQFEKELSKRLFNRSLLIYQYLLKVETDFTYERHLRLKELKEFLLQ